MDLAANALLGSVFALVLVKGRVFEPTVIQAQFQLKGMQSRKRGLHQRLASHIVHEELSLCKRN